MTTSPAPTALDRYARIAGAGYLVIIVTGIFAEFFVRQSLIVAGDGTATAENILASEGLYRLGLASELFMLLADVMVAGALFVVFRPVNRGLALLAAFFRLAHAAVVGVNLLNVFLPLLLLSGASYLAVFELDQLHALVLIFLEAHAYGYALGLVFFSVHCGLLGYLIVTSRYVPRVLGILLIVAGAGYLIDALARSLLTQYAEVEPILAPVLFTPAVVGELAFCLWLLVRGVRPPPVGPGPVRDVIRA